MPPEKYQAQVERAVRIYEQKKVPGALPVEFFVDLMGLGWDKWHPGSANGAKGRFFVCRNVGAEMVRVARDHGHEADMDWWETEDPHVYHTTPAIKIGGAWYAFESHFSKRLGHHDATARKLNRPHRNPNFPQSVILTRDQKQVDLGWYRNVNLWEDRGITKWRGKVPEDFIHEWGIENFWHQLTQGHEVGAHEAEALCDGKDSDDRRTPI